MNCILVGRGEIGNGVYDAYSRVHNIDTYDIKYTVAPKLSNYELLLVAIPYSDDFVEIVKKYQDMFKVKSTIIFSTVPIGTTSQINHAVHVPIEGKHPHLSESIRRWQVFMGGRNNLAMEFFTQAAKLVYQLDKPEHSEFLKLQSTSNYGLMIEYARYVKSVADELGMSYNDVKMFNLAYNSLYSHMGILNFQRYILNPPEGNLGGHCVVPNAMLLDKEFPSIFLKEIYRDKEGQE